jgi:hypothetical protein
MKSRVLLNTQRKALHDILVNRGLNPAVSRWTNDQKGWTNDEVDTLEIGLCHFLFNASYDGTYSIHFRPGLDGGAPLGAVNQSWNSVLGAFSQWALHAKNETEQEDPWQLYSAYLPPERRGDSIDNSPYTHQEAEQLVRALSRFKEHVRKSLPHYNDVANQFEPQFDRLAKQAKAGAGRIDWSNQFVGTLINLCMALSLAPDAAASLWHFWVGVVDTMLLP